ncbi:TorD/DmsD family molecular chaperone [Desulfitobacterium dehalogenans]|nr:molecular chaperone TorD family protein [Desulfitobacterium dehalogenans]
MKDVMDWTRDRFHSYAFFASLLVEEPTLEKWLTIQKLSSSLSGELLEDKNGIRIPEEAQATMERLRQDYYDCFFVPMSGKYVPPYESALRCFKQKPKPSFGKINTSLTAQIKQQYELTGFDPYRLELFSPLKNIPLADHVGFELAYMAYLCQQEHEARKEAREGNAERWLEIQKEFMAEHLLMWIPSLAEALRTLENGFYSQAIKTLEIWLHEDDQDVKNYFSRGGICVEC